MLFSYTGKEIMQMVRRKDNKGRVLEKGETQRKDGRYVYQYMDIDGNRKSVYASNLSDLRKKEKQIRRDFEDNINVVNAKMTLNELFDQYMELKTQIANSTRQNYINLWNGRIRDEWLGNRKICDIKKSDILRFYDSLYKELKYSTLKTFNGILSPCLEFAVNDDVIRKNPCKGCMKEFANDAEERIALTETQQREFLKFVQESKVYSVYYPMFSFMIGTAVRCGEAIGLTWNDVDFKNREISINHQLIYKKINGKYEFYADKPKTESGIRVIPMTREVYKALLEQRELQVSRGRRTNVEIDGYKDFVFSTKNRSPIMPSAVNNILLNIVNKYNLKKENTIELPHISAHNLRHTGCTRMAEAGMDLKVLQYVMGHSEANVTMKVYNHVLDERKRKEMDKVEKIRLIG